MEHTEIRAELNRIQLEMDIIQFERNLRDLIRYRERRYRENQPRVPAGNADGGRWTDGNGIGTSPGALGLRQPAARPLLLVAANKADIAFITYLCRKYGLDLDKRERLHEDITGLHLSREQIEQAASDLADLDEEEE